MAKRKKVPYLRHSPYAYACKPRTEVRGWRSVVPAALKKIVRLLGANPSDQLCSHPKRRSSTRAEHMAVPMRRAARNQLFFANSAFSVVDSWCIKMHRTKRCKREGRRYDAAGFGAAPATAVSDCSSCSWTAVRRETRAALAESPLTRAWARRYLSSRRR